MAKRSRTDKSKVHKDLADFSIRLNAFGQIETTIGIDQLNAFLNEHIYDKKLNELKDEAGASSEAEEDEGV